ncbi:hypothetical protein GCM10010507_38330 [Streptomyces cinnamoneus]|uniref:Calcium-binding protein n=1 Tax=Streptomyces cinnamoneus TaxID=53446 RepID=A0A918TRL7_STRCJ|nr:hypothetical protein GCM10010507_38330 [Streptomyces cinnamoneus]
MKCERLFVAVGVCTLLVVVTGCGTAGAGSATSPASPTARIEAAPPPPPDKGPLYDGDKDGSPGIEGIRILRGGIARLPGGATVAHAEAHSDGTSRNAVLAEGVTPADRRDGQHWTVAPHGGLTVEGRAYTVRQICTYRVVLTPQSSDDASPGPGPGPGPAPAKQGSDNSRPAGADGRWRLRWHVPHTQSGGEGYSVILYDAHDNPKRADIGGPAAAWTARARALTARPCAAGTPAPAGST